MTIRLTCVTLLYFLGAAASVQANPLAKMVRAAEASFANMPWVEVTETLSEVCGADESVNKLAVYCTSNDTIFLDRYEVGKPRSAYLLAHLFAHAAQVQHGVADVALRTIQSRRSEEAALRRMVEGQVDCVAGVLIQRAGLPEPDLTEWFDADPFPDRHWGRHPLRNGPVMGVDLNVREQWLNRGYSRGLASCTSGEFGPDLLLIADQF